MANKNRDTEDREYIEVAGHRIEKDDERSYIPDGLPDEDVLIQQQDGIPENDVTDDMLTSDLENAESWLTYNKGLRSIGYSPAEMITSDNVDSLEQVYFVETESVGLESNPLVVPGDPPVLYFTEENITLHAVNARTGEEFWQFQPELPDDPGGIIHSRGAAVYGDKVYFTTPQAEIVALDRYSGELQWRESTLNEKQQSFGEQEWRLSITQAPMAYDGKILSGQSSDAGGWTASVAHDAETGEKVWHRSNAPPEEYVGETWKFANNATWMTAAIDPETDTVYWSAGNPNPMYNGTVRPGPNKNSNSIIAIDTNTGELKWENQLIPHELWDADVCNPPMIIDADTLYDEFSEEYSEEIADTNRIVSHDWKGGWNYVLDAEDGRLLQRSEPFAEPGGEAYLKPVPAGQENEAPFFPIPAAEWGPQAYSPQTGLHYVGVADAGRYLWSDPNWQYKPDEQTFQGRGGGHRGIPPEDLEELGREGYASVVAIDPMSGRSVWETRIEEVNPENIGGRYAPGGTTATAGGVVFNGASSGHLVAFDAESGDKLASYETQTQFRGQRIQAGPITWVDPEEDRQYVAVTGFDGLYTFATSA